MGDNIMLKLWTNAEFPPEPTRRFEAGVSSHELIRAQESSSLNLISAPPDARLLEAEIAFGQPDVEQLFESERLKWVHLTTAGYTKYDRDDLRDSFRRRGIVMTNSSSVYAEPCAQHALAMILGFARQLIMSYDEQRSERAWSYVDIRRRSFLMGGQTVILYGYGAIARRLSELLAPLRVKLIGVRRRPRGDEFIPTVSLEDHVEWLKQADHVINILPASAQSRNFFDATMFQNLKPTAYFYNIGRGTTVDQMALIQALQESRIAGAYLDVTDPEPLPVDHPLWSAPNCFITPHTAGGYDAEMFGLVDHFLDNLRRFEQQEDLIDQII
jgi:phosphoglycerate dehydrogenase-like enzyme